ncbi:MAG: flagellar type III secretion system pore protein FliP [Hyphomicrobiales bacterium]|nr:flagellar type III secretion system pore protein FliP [Hyphomicrobiales bacterium]
MMRAALTIAAAALILPGDAAAQTISLEGLIPEGGSATGRMIQVALAVTLLSLAPGILVVATCFTRFVIALSFLRAGLGLPTTPANLILISLALFMTLTVMAPVFDRAYQEGVKPLIAEEISEEEAYVRITAPFRAFMAAHVRPQDVALFEDMAAPAKTQAAPPAAAPEAERTVELRALIPAFMLSELRRGVEIGFLIMLPFLVIDLVVATLTMSMGMMMLSPSVISLPFKVLFFVLIDGWSLLVGGLMRSFS